MIRCHDAVIPAIPNHTFIATSDVHVAHKLKQTRKEVLEITHQMAIYMLAVDVKMSSFSAEDAVRSDPDFLCEVFSQAIDCCRYDIDKSPECCKFTQHPQNLDIWIDAVTISAHGHGRPENGHGECPVLSCQWRMALDRWNALLTVSGAGRQRVIRGSCGRCE